MPLYEFFCAHCPLKFELITSAAEAEKKAECPKCGKKESARLISKFAVAGRGDLRESTMHGCHDHSDGHDHEDH